MTFADETDIISDISEDILLLVCFILNKEEFAIDIIKIHEIIRIVDITKVPKSPAFVEGIMNLRGKVIPVIDLRKRLQLDAADFTKESRIIVIDIDDSNIGLIVDSVSEVLGLPKETIEPAPVVKTSIESEFIEGVGKLENRLIILLDINRVLTVDEINELKETGTG